MAGPPSPHDLEVILVAPNVSEQRGGEAIKALQIYLELDRQGVRVHQVTHDRAREEMERKFPAMSVSFLADTELEKFIHRARLSEQMLNMIFLHNAAKEVRRLLRESPDAVVHFTSPVSPVLPYPVVPGARVVIGPINGNIHYPPGFRHREGLSHKFRRWLHPAMQFLHRHSWAGKRRADALLVAGGQRTYDSLRMAGCRPEQLVDSIDSGVLNRLYDVERIGHSGPNLRFYHNGRLVEHKGTDLILKALTRTKNPIELDIIGWGPELPGLKALAASLNLGDRVHFIEWVKEHEDLARMLRTYRGFVFPSLAEANGIVVQEAMVLGLPVIACNWGGPSLLVTPETGILIDPISEQYVIEGLAAAMDKLAMDGDLAERMSIAARQRALTKGFLWSGVITDWREVYNRVAARSTPETVDAG